MVCVMIVVVVEEEEQSLVVVIASCLCPLLPHHQVKSVLPRFSSTVILLSDALFWSRASWCYALYNHVSGRHSGHGRNGCIEQRTGVQSLSIRMFIVQQETVFSVANMLMDVSREMGLIRWTGFSRIHCLTLCSKIILKYTVIDEFFSIESGEKEISAI